MFFGTKDQLFLRADIHSHLIPGVDDGVKTLEQSIEIIREFQKLGYSKLITTPHISESHYPNYPDTLRKGVLIVMEELSKQGINMEIELGAEYMADGAFLKLLKEDGDLLSWQGYVLVETGFSNYPLIFDEIIFEIKAKGLHPVLAHPERYGYWFGNTKSIKNLRERGVKMQVTASSFVGYYGSDQKKMAKSLLKESLIDFIGSDMHSYDQMEYLKRGLASQYLRKLDLEKLLNESLLT
ncbi:MAG: capsular biosynthesis protein [Cytophagales bacterium]|nr:capsular biosynthesis protein [Cytophagales bacterium]